MLPMTDARAALIAVQQDSERARARFRFSADLPVFAGHFPGRPLVPGVYLLACVAVLAAHAQAAPLTLRAIARAKWTAPVMPEEEFQVEITWRPAESGWQVDGTITVAGTQCASCRLVMGQGAGPQG